MLDLPSGVGEVGLGLRKKKLQTAFFDFILVVTYIEALNDYGIFVVASRSLLLRVNCTDILLNVPSHDHDLPLAPIPRNTAESGASLAACL